MSYNPAANSSWASAKKASPSRAPFSDEELERVRVRCAPENISGHAPHFVGDLVIIWTLLDMLEEERGWRV